MRADREEEEEKPQWVGRAATAPSRDDSVEKQQSAGYELRGRQKREEDQGVGGGGTIETPRDGGREEDEYRKEGKGGLCAVTCRGSKFGYSSLQTASWDDVFGYSLCSVVG